MKTSQQLPTTQTTLRRKLFTWATALSLALSALTPLTARATAPSSAVPFVQALADAQKVASTHPGWKVFQAKGQSMEPEFGSFSLLIATNADFSTLRPGMLVVYRDQSGDLVAHRLMAVTTEGWVVKGLNNDKADPGKVTRDNFQGVVFGSLNFKSGTENQMVASDNTAPPVAFAKTY
jgi:hypothetical protein